MKAIGSQRRETVKQAKCKVLQYRNAELIVLTPEGEFEIWMLNDYYAGYVLEFDGCGFEYCRSIDALELYNRLLSKGA